MKRLILLMSVMVALGLNAQNKLSVNETKQLDKKADSIACASHHLLLGCFEKWDNANYNQSIIYLKQSQALYKKLMEDGTAQTDELAELRSVMIQTKLSLVESSIMLFDERFANIMGNPGDEKMKKKKYNGSEILIPKSQEYKFDGIVSKLGTFCE